MFELGGTIDVVYTTADASTAGVVVGVYSS